MYYWLYYEILFALIAIFSMVLEFDFLYVLFLFLGVCGSFVDIALITKIQNLSDDKNIGKNFGIFSTLANSTGAFSALLLGLFSLINISVTFIVMAMLIVFSAFVFHIYIKKAEL